MENNLKEKPLNMPHNLIVDILEKSYDNKSKSIQNNAIKNMKFNVPQGQFCCLVGPSGCGKTTLLNLLSGLDENLNGIVKYQDGSIPKDWPIGYMFQEPRLMPWLSVKQNVTIVTQQTSEEIELSENLVQISR